MFSPRPIPTPNHYPAAIQSGEGICLIDKSSGISSHGVVNALRRHFGVKKVGHAGTLDPLASGLLICLVGRSFTRLQEQFLKLPKTYLCEFQLGISTDTYDSTGALTHQAEWLELQNLTQHQTEMELASFIGSHPQQVPAFCAVKIKGEKLYQKARRGVTQTITDLPSRIVTFLKLKLIEWEVDEINQTLKNVITISCSSGTYIRSLIHDLGQKLGVGACVTELRRTSIGDWGVDSANEISDKKIKLYQAKTQIPTLQVTDSDNNLV